MHFSKTCGSRRDKEGFEAQKKFIPIQLHMNVSFMPKEFSYKITITIFSSFKNHLRNELLNHTIVNEMFKLQ